MAVNFGEIKRIDIIGLLERTGIRPVRNYLTYALYHAPYREDRHPSFKVSRKKNRWYDLATMESGDIIDLGKMMYNTNDIMEVIRHIQKDRKSTRLNSSHANISYAVFCLKKKIIQNIKFQTISYIRMSLL